MKTVVVGAGNGGLFAATILAKNGFPVTVIEQHDKVGGFASNFKRRKHRMEVAIHVIEGRHQYDERGLVFDYLKIWDNVSLIRLPQFYRCHVGEFEFEMPNDLESARQSVSEAFPAEREGINLYFDLSRDFVKMAFEFQHRQPRIAPSSPLFAALYPQYAKVTGVSAGQFIDRVFKDTALKTLLLGNVTFYHDKPYELSLIHYLIAQGSYYLGCAHVIDGGSQALSDYLARIILDHGGQIILNHNVDRLVTEKNKIVGVEFHKIRGDQRETKSLPCDFLIANAPMPVVYRDLLGDSASKTKLQEIRSYGESVSATTLFYGLKSSLKDLGCQVYMNLFADPIATAFGREPESRHFGLMNSSAIKGLSNLEQNFSNDVIFMDRMDNWRNLSTNDYKSKKQKVAQHFTERLNRIYPGFRDAVDFVEVGTPRTIERYTKNPNGVAYAFLPSPESFEKRMTKLMPKGFVVDEQFDNLYFASAWSNLPGHTPTAIAGHRAAQAILQKAGIPPIYTV